MSPPGTEKAQAEIDANIDVSRSPDFHDFSKLPYINAIVKERMRWRPVSSVAPHKLREDDTYEGYLFSQFRPERYESHDKLAGSYAGSANYAMRGGHSFWVEANEQIIIRTVPGDEFVLRCI
jgi:hypothetical protein